MKYFKIIIALILVVTLDTMSYGSNDARIDTTSIIFAVSKRINNSIIVHYDKPNKINDSILKTVEDRLSSPIDLATGIAFCKEAFYLNDIDINKPIGYIPKSANANPSTPMESLIFVTSELNHDNGVILVFLSAVSPARLTIFSIDKNIRINILYDTFDKNTFKDTTIGSVENITVIKKGIFRASERKDILNESLWPTPRQILISKNNDEFKMDIIGGNDSDDYKK